MPIDNLQAFYKKYYQPDNVVLIVAGKFDEAKALALLEKYLGSIPRPTRKLDATYTEEPPQDGERTVTLRRVGAVASVGVAYHIPSSAHPDSAAARPARRHHLAVAQRPALQGPGRVEARHERHAPVGQRARSRPLLRVGVVLARVPRRGARDARERRSNRWETCRLLKMK